MASAKKHSSEAFYGCDDPLEAAIFSALVEIARQRAGTIPGRARHPMWVLDSAYRGDGVDLWSKEGAVRLVHHEYDPPFYLCLPDPDEHHGMITALGEQYRAEPCTFRTIFGECDGYKVFAGRTVAEAIERQAGYAAQLFNVDVRRDQRFMAEHGIVPCCTDTDSRFSPEFTHDLGLMEVRVRGDPALVRTCPEIDVVHERAERLSGSERDVLSDLFSLVAAYDPDVVLMADADRWMPLLQGRGRELGLALPFSRNGKYRTMDSRSYWSYGKVGHKEAALIPDGRVLIDTEQSFVYREGGLAGVLMAARLSGLPPSLVSRFTPGTLISAYETYEAVRRGIAVPFRKSDAEALRKLSSLRTGDRGGMMFQPEPGTYENVDEIDFTSMYPSIIVKENLSPETIGRTGEPGLPPHRPRTPAHHADRNKTDEKNRSCCCRHRCGPQVDARHLLRLHRLQERKVRQDRGARGHHRQVARDPAADKSNCRCDGVYRAARERGLPLGAGLPGPCTAGTGQPRDRPPYRDRALRLDRIPPAERRVRGIHPLLRQAP